jgi:hypothetical protein
VSSQLHQSRPKQLAARPLTPEMPVEKGASWGQRGAPPAGALGVSSDSAAAGAFGQAAVAGEKSPAIVLLGGDLFRTLGGSEGREPASRFLVDVGEVRHDTGEAYFVAHVVARRGWWKGRVDAVMNAEFLGEWKVAPRSHPGDGLFDICSGDLTVRQRLLARRRLPAGDHIPHPDIRMSRSAEADLNFDSPTDIWVDGIRVAKSRSLSVRLLAAALEVYV